MRRINATLLFALIFSFSLYAQNQQVWTLDDCIKQALDQNVLLKRQDLATETSRKDFAQSKLNVLPSLGGMVEHNLGSGRVLDRGTYEWVNTDVSQGDLGVQANLTLFEGLMGYNSIRMARANFMMEKENLNIMKNNVTLQVMNGYLDVLRKMDLKDIAEEKTRITGLQVERMARLMEVGNASQGELLEVKAQHSTELYNFTVARNSLNTARLTLIHLLNLNPREPFAVSRPDIPDPSYIPVPDLDTVYVNALRFLPEIKGAEYNIEHKKHLLAVNRGALSPELYVRGLYYSNYSDKLINPRELDPFNPVLDYPIPLQVTDNQYRQVSVGLNIPIFNKWQTNTNISKAKIGLEDAQYFMEDQKQQLLKSIQQYYADALGAFDNYNAANETFINSEEAYRYTEEKFKVGMATALELEEARNRLYASQSEMITTKYVYFFFIKILDFYQGKDIDLAN